MTFTLHYAPEVVRNDIPRLPKSDKERISTAIEEKLTTQPESFGKPLRRSLKGYRKLRVGDYRVVFRIVEDSIRILAIGKRETVYDMSIGRVQYVRKK